jgi:HAD superfamily hydrolase (TIGR01509 family)
LSSRAYPFEGAIESIVFDFDGVLVDSDELHWRAYHEALADYGVAFSLEDYRERAKGRDRGSVIELFCSHLGEAERQRIAEAKGEAARQLLASGCVGPVEGAVEFVRSARDRGLPCAVASTSEIAGFAVEALGLADLFDCVAAKQRSDRPKPHPDVFLRALRGLGMPAQTCLAIEDTAVGARAARNAGLQVIVRWLAEACAGQESPQDVLGCFETYAELHAGLGWGCLGERIR